MIDQNKKHDFLKMKRGVPVIALMLVAALLAVFLAGCKAPPTEEDPSSRSSSTAFSNPLDKPNFAATGPVETGKVTKPEGEPAENLTALIESNSDTVAWVKVDGPGIDLGIVQTRNNSDYTRLGYDRKYSWVGALFADYECNFGPGSTRETISRNNVIYGHNVDDDRETGKMFSQLLNYDDPEYATQHPYIWLYTEDDAMLFFVFAAFRSEATNWYIFPNQTDDKFLAVIAEAKLRSEILTDDIDVVATDKIITLATCTNEYTGDWTQRWAVMGRLAREGELQNMEITYTKNPSPKLPK